MTEEELNVLSKIKERPVEEQRDFLLEQNMLLTGKIATLRKDKEELCHSISEGGKACVYLNEQLTKAKKIIQEFLDLNYSEFTKTNAVFLHADKFLKESK